MQYSYYLAERPQISGTGVFCIAYVLPIALQCLVNENILVDATWWKNLPKWHRARVVEDT